MLTDFEVAGLMAILKYFVDNSQIDFPLAGELFNRDAKSEDGHEQFIIDVNRKGKISRTKCTFQNRYQVTEILYRLDIDGPPHENPDGQNIPCPHLHVYKEGFAEKWAFPLSIDVFTDPLNLSRTFKEFLTLCNIQNIPAIQMTL